MLTSESVCAFPQLQILSSTRRHTIIRHTMSIRLVEGGLAMVAGQSCIAGPSVYFPSCHIRFLCEPHLPFFKIGNKKGASKGDGRRGGCLHSASTPTPRTSEASRVCILTTPHSC